MDGFWDDAPNAAKIQKEKSVLDEVVKTYLHLKQLYDDFDVLWEFASTENDESSAVEAIESYKNFLVEFNLAETKSEANEVWRLPAESNGERRTSLCTPDSDFRSPKA